MTRSSTKNNAPPTVTSIAKNKVKKVQSRVGSGGGGAMKKAVVQGFKRILSPVDEHEELHTETPQAKKKPTENTRPTRRLVSTAKVSYKEEDDVDDEDTEPESSEDDEEENYRKKKKPKDKSSGLKKVTKARGPVSPSKKRMPPSPKKKKHEARRLPASARPPSTSAGSAISPRLAAVTSFSPAQITHDMWKPHKNDWRVTDAIDY